MWREKAWTLFKRRTHKRHSIARKGELWGVLCELFGKKLPRDIESALYTWRELGYHCACKCPCTEKCNTIVKHSAGFKIKLVYWLLTILKAFPFIKRHYSKWRISQDLVALHCPVSLTVFPSQFKFDGNLFHSHIDSNTVIATKFCTWHDSCAVVACATLCCDLMASNGVMARRSFHRIWIAGKKPLVKQAPAALVVWPSSS